MFIVIKYLKPQWAISLPIKREVSGPWQTLPLLCEGTLLMKLFPAVLACVLGALTGVLPVAAMEKRIVGWVERVRIYPEDVPLEAKVDTGAEYCSLNATSITKFQRHSKEWVRIVIDDHQGRKIVLERPLLREATIKRHFAKSQVRPVVRLGICLGNLYQEAEVNLVDRTGFKYPMLIGRKFMEGRLLVDPSLTFTVAPVCGEQPASE